MGMFSAGLYMGIHNAFPVAGWDKVLAHGVAGGIMSELQGGDFGSGFLAGSFTQAVSWKGGFDRLGDPRTWEGRLKNAIAAAVVGGTASVIGGGKFANGALTGAFSRLFNDLSDELWMDERGKIHKGRHPNYSEKGCADRSGYACQLSPESPHTLETDARLLGATSTLLAVGAFGGTVAGISWAAELGWAAYGAQLGSVVLNPNASAYDYFSFGLSTRTQVIEFFAPGATLVHQGVGLVIDGMGRSFDEFGKR